MTVMDGNLEKLSFKELLIILSINFNSYTYLDEIEIRFHFSPFDIDLSMMSTVR